jgi:type III secretion protein J
VIKLWKRRQKSPRSDAQEAHGNKSWELYQRLVLLLALMIVSSGCDEQILHDLSEQDANRVVSRLGGASHEAKKVLQSDGRWAIAVPHNRAVPALSFLETNRVLNPRAPGSGHSAKSGFVPSREEQWFRYERSVATAIEDSLGAVLGVLEARVHLHLPQTDPLFGTRHESIGSGSVLLVVDERYTSKHDEVAALVAGAAGIPAAKVTVLCSPTGSAHAPSVQGQKVALGHSEQPAQRQPDIPVADGNQVQITPPTRIDMGVTIAGVALSMVVGAVVVLRRRRRVRFPLPRSGPQTSER